MKDGTLRIIVEHQRGKLKHEVQVDFSKEELEEAKDGGFLEELIDNQVWHLIDNKLQLDKHLEL